MPVFQPSVNSITGTANQVVASNPTGAVTLSTPQDIATGSSPTFANLTTSSAINLGTTIGNTSQAYTRIKQALVRATNASGTQSIAANTVVAITFATEAFDTAGMHSTSSNTSRLTAVVAGKYQITGGVLWTAQTLAAGTNFLLCRLSKNGGAIEGSRSYFPPIAGFNVNGQGQNVSSLIELAVNDYVELEVFHDATSAAMTINLANSSFQAALIGE